MSAPPPFPSHYHLCSFPLPKRWQLKWTSVHSDLSCQINLPNVQPLVIFLSQIPFPCLIKFPNDIYLKHMCACLSIYFSQLDSFLPVIPAESLFPLPPQPDLTQLFISSLGLCLESLSCDWISVYPSPRGQTPLYTEALVSCLPSDSWLRGTFTSFLTMLHFLFCFFALSALI